MHLPFELCQYFHSSSLASLCTYQVNEDGVTFRVACVIEITRGYGARVEPVGIGLDFFCGVRGPHFDGIGVIAQLGPLWLEDPLEELGVADEHVLVDMECDCFVALAGDYFDYLAAETAWTSQLVVCQNLRLI
jgi:hypothetical protein